MNPPQPPLGATPEPSATPRTDAAERSLESWQINCDDNVCLVSAKVARTLETELATARAALAQEVKDGKRLRDALVKCFVYLGKEIKRKPLNESAADGTQALSREIAALLDAAIAASAPATTGKGGEIS